MIKYQEKVNKISSDASNKAKQIVRLQRRTCTNKGTEYLLLIADIPIRPYLELSEANNVKLFMQDVIKKVIIRARK